MLKTILEAVIVACCVCVVAICICPSIAERVFDPPRKLMYSEVQTISEPKGEPEAPRKRPRRSIQGPFLSPEECPVCGSPMELKARHSDGHVFKSCIRWPACRGTRNVD